MKHTYFLISLLFGIALGATIHCSEELDADDDEQSDQVEEVQDADDESDELASSPSDVVKASSDTTAGQPPVEKQLQEQRTTIPITDTPTIPAPQPITPSSESILNKETTPLPGEPVVATTTTTDAQQSQEQQKAVQTMATPTAITPPTTATATIEAQEVEKPKEPEIKEPEATDTDEEVESIESIAESETPTTDNTQVLPTPSVTPAVTSVAETRTEKPAEQPSSALDTSLKQTIITSQPLSVTVPTPVTPVSVLEKTIAQPASVSLPTSPTQPSNLPLSKIPALESESSITTEKIASETDEPIIDLLSSHEPALTGPLTGKSIKQAITQLSPLIMSRSVEKTVEQFTNLPADEALALLKQLIKINKIDFSKKHKGRPFEIKRNDFLQIIFGVASQYRDPIIYNQFFNLIDEYPGLEYGIRPLLFVLSISSYPVLIPDLITWLEKRAYDNPIEETALYAINRTSARSINALATYTTQELKPFLGKLLIYAISNKKPLKIITALVDAGADVNFPDASGYTPLIKAVEMGNLPVTKFLIARKADMDLILQDEVGSAWQKASELAKDTIMLYLKEHDPKKIVKPSW